MVERKTYKLTYLLLIFALSFVYSCDNQIKNKYRHGVNYFYTSNKYKILMPLNESGQIHGKYIIWFDNGQKKFEWNFNQGIRDGKCERWWENGQKKREDYYLKGKLHGKLIEWNPIGEVIKEEIYKQGALVEMEGSKAIN